MLLSLFNKCKIQSLTTTLGSINYNIWNASGQNTAGPSWEAYFLWAFWYGKIDPTWLYMGKNLETIAEAQIKYGKNS